jgi:hypothetical protein
MAHYSAPSRLEAVKGHRQELGKQPCLILHKAVTLGEVFQNAQARSVLERYATSIHAHENVQAVLAIDMLARKEFKALNVYLIQVACAAETNEARKLDDMKIFSKEYLQASLRFPGAEPKGRRDDHRTALLLAQRVFNTFFAPEAPCWACLEATMLQDLFASLSADRCLLGSEFQAARLLCFASIKTDIFPRFLHDLRRTSSAVSLDVGSSPSLGPHASKRAKVRTLWLRCARLLLVRA